MRLRSNYNIKIPMDGTSLVIQLLRLLDSNAGGVGTNSGQETKIPHATEHGQKTKKKVTLKRIKMPKIPMDNASTPFTIKTLFSFSADY